MGRRAPRICRGAGGPRLWSFGRVRVVWGRRLCLVVFCGVFGWLVLGCGLFVVCCLEGVGWVCSGYVILCRLVGVGSRVVVCVFLLFGFY